jgi:hypothetical protein
MRADVKELRARIDQVDAGYRKLSKTLSLSNTEDAQIYES